jgi:Ca2+-binding RTX toxin-like protein
VSSHALPSARRFRLRTRRLTAYGGLALIAALAAASPAAAQDAASCRASAARATTGPQVTSEPVVANAPSGPCSTQTQRTASTQPVGPLTVSDPKASTRLGPGVIAATSSVEGAQLGDAASGVAVGHVEATQMASCTAGNSVSSGSSRVDSLSIGGQAVTLVGDRPVDQTIGGIRVRFNQVTGGTRQALILDIGPTQLVLGEATASGDACAAGGGPGGPGDGDDNDNPRICPAGAEYDPEANLCVIRIGGGSGGGGGGQGGTQTIVVGRPYEGPSGGTVIALVVAREMAAQGKLPKSGCLGGPGPKYVVLGTKGANHITGTNGPDRILGLAGKDRLDGGRGNDCIDGGTSRDVISGGQGDDRSWGGSGNDAVNGGSGNDNLRGGSGKDSINTGFGRDKVDGGSGNDRINAATAGPGATIRGGSGRDTVRINRNERRKTRGAERIFVIK